MVENLLFSSYFAEVSGRTFLPRIKEKPILYLHLISHRLASYMATGAMICFIYLPNLELKKVKWTMRERATEHVSIFFI